jgi:hypothetical protein
MAVHATLLSAPFAHLSAECAGILDVSTVSRYRADAELTKLQTLVAAYRAIIVARLGRHSLDTLLAPQDAFLAGLDTLAIGFVQLRHERIPLPNDIPLAPTNLGLREGHLLAGSDLHREGFQDQ